MDDLKDLCQWLQQYCTSSVSENVVKIVKKLAQAKRNEGEFGQAVKMVLKFKEKDSSVIISKIYDKFKDTTPEVAPTIEKNIKPSVVKKKRLISLTFDDESDDEVDIPPPIKQRSMNGEKTFTFKKLDKAKANSLKKYAEIKDSNPFFISGKASPSSSTTTPPETISHIEALSDQDDELPILPKNDKFAKVDEEWYNYDDDPGNIATEELDALNNLDFSSKNEYKPRFQPNHESSDVQIYPLSIDKKKTMLPPFLTAYSNKYSVSNAAIVGSIAESNNDGIIDPFRNPESVFTTIARKGSHLVNLKRMAKEQKRRNKNNTELSNTAMGKTVGVTSSNTSLKTKANPIIKQTNDVQTQDEIQKQRQSLPAYKARDSLTSMISNNQVVIIIGETGSGKTTQLPQILYKAGFCHDNTIIGITQPRRVAAMSVAKRVAEEMDTPVGEKVGYSIRFEDQTSAQTRIKFMTDGILLRETLLDPLLLKYNCIIIDEAHERSLNTDVLLGIFKTLLTKRKDIKLIITSATMNALKFSKFFGNAPQFTIPGRTFPVQINYAKSPVEDYVESAVTEAIRIHMQTSITSGDILIFMTGQEDIETTCDSIKERLIEVYSKKNGISEFGEIDDIEIYPIYSALPPELQQKIFHKLDSSRRKIVVATNIAETSLTIDGIKYVIDCGYSKLKVYNPRIGLDSLMITPISLANANQRSGRAGRTGPGIAYRLYTQESAHEDMYLQTIPEIQRTNLSNTILLLKSLGIQDIVHFPFIDKPPLQTLLASLYELWFLDAIDNFGDLTPLGKQMSKFPLQASLSKILILASQNKCSTEILTVVSMLSVPQIFNRPKEREKEADLARARFFVPRSDHLTLLNVYSQWKSNKFSPHWCEKHFLNYRSLARAHEIRKQLITVMKKSSIPLVSSGSDWNVIRRCICSGFAHQAAKVAGLSQYVNLKTGLKVELHPTSALFGLSDPPSYVVYHELLMTSKEYMCFVTAVDPFWLMEYAPLIYDIKRVKDFGGEHHGYSMFSLSKTEADKDDDFKDEIDINIDRYLSKRKLLVDQIDSDAKASLLSKNGSIDKNKKASNKAVTIGFKRRRPF